MDSAPLKALALVCTLTPSPKPSSSELLARQVVQQLSSHGVECDLLRVVDHDIKPGVQTDMGDGDAWPGIRERVLGADILVLATPIWLGHRPAWPSRCWSGWMQSSPRPIARAGRACSTRWHLSPSSVMKTVRTM
ncbi:hypothetical protein D477_020083 [Arthrobacter crystallopoietes BAB-32]|uniref:NADPH-dependent FMN reductase-like domain-containing protein n=1 Tax=Arthrobacter crystallopoietes BAB-32 TaxID=1246476 RepID=N1V2G3_9MICC|nr:hypothetical protein D477_020083 [Arthrobacter crystallopoietes BAB-32]